MFRGGLAVGSFISIVIYILIMTIGGVKLYHIKNPDNNKTSMVPVTLNSEMVPKLRCVVLLLPILVLADAGWLMDLTRSSLICFVLLSPPPCLLLRHPIMTSDHDDVLLLLPYIKIWAIGTYFALVDLFHCLYYCL